MTITVLELGLVVLGAMVMAIACTLVGAFVMFRGSSRTPGDSFLGGRLRVRFSLFRIPLRTFRKRDLRPLYWPGLSSF